jgi:hypothetical protein
VAGIASPVTYFLPYFLDGYVCYTSEYSKAEYMTLDDVSKLAQRCFQQNPTIILGSGASVPYGLPGMYELSAFLKENVITTNQIDTEVWNSVVLELDAEKHLEAALDGKNLSPNLLSQIIKATWNCVNIKDYEFYRKIISTQTHLPLGRLLNKLFQSTSNSLNIITTNYDRVIEYSCNHAGLLFNTGFSPGYIQKWEATNSVVFYRHNRPSRVVKISKVHGSLDWFLTQEKILAGLPLFSIDGTDYEPLIVTPGLNKYEKTHQEPFRSILTVADTALQTAAAFLCIGYGFRDEHIHPKIQVRCKEVNVPIVVLARTLTDEAREFLFTRAGDQYLGIEQHENGSRVYTKANPTGELIANADIWSLEGFLSLVE